MSTPPLGETLFGFSRSFLWILYPGSRRRSLAESHVSVTRAMSICWSVRNLPSSGSLFFMLVAFHSRILSLCLRSSFEFFDYADSSLNFLVDAMAIDIVSLHEIQNFEEYVQVGGFNFLKSVCNIFSCRRGSSSRRSVT